MSINTQSVIIGFIIVTLGHSLWHSKTLCSAEYLSLDGTDWTAVSFNKTIKTKAKVPGSIYSDLRNGGVLKEDIYHGQNDMNYRWVAYDNWTYERTFNVDSTLLNKKSVNLLAQGIDTVSTVYVNDKIVGKTNNQFVRYKFDIKNVLKSGQNTIKVSFMSAPIYSVESAKEFEKKYKYIVFPECDKSKGPHLGECHPNFIRKMASSYSWDWGPAFPTQGIWKSIGIEAHDKPIIRDITVETTPNPSYTEWTLTVNTFVELTTKEKTEGIFNIDFDGKPVMKDIKKEIDSQKDEIIKVVFKVTLKDIIAWFPNGVANNTQKLYQLKVSLSFAGSSEVSTQTKRIGFRKIELIQKPIQPEGLTFYFQVNGIPFFAKGTNWIPANSLMENLTPYDIQHLMSSTKGANMNMMRVWGGGIYESDLFYELADEMGIMIWQDFMFACALYPTNPEFLETVDQELITQVRRLQHHPSIAIWSGNNENEMIIAAFFRGSKEFRSDYIKLTIDHIQTRVTIEDPSRPFVSSSPSNGLESNKEDHLAKDPNDKRYGDVHYYNDGANLWDWKTYPSAKFASEYGFQSYPSLNTLSEVLNESDFTFPVSKAIEHRQRHPGGTGAIENQISKYLKMPSKGGKDRFNDLVYLSQITQAMAMKTETEFYRRNRDIDPKTGEGNTMGALYWQLNDIWEGQSWSSVEFGGRWKVLHNYAKDFMSNLLVSPFENIIFMNDVLLVSLVRDDHYGDLEFDLSIKVYKWSENKAIHEINTKVKTGSFSAKVVYTKSMPELLKESKCMDRKDCVLSFEVKNSVKKIEAQNFMLLSEPKNSHIVAPKLKLVGVKEAAPHDNHNFYEITLSSEAVAPFVVLDFKHNSGFKGHFLDNGFFVFEGKKTVVFKTHQKLSEQQFRDNLIIKTLTDVV